VRKSSLLPENPRDIQHLNMLHTGWDKTSHSETTLSHSRLN